MAKSIMDMLDKIKPPAGAGGVVSIEKVEGPDQGLESAFMDLVDALGLKHVDHAGGISALKHFCEICGYHKSDEEEPSDSEE